MRAKEFGPPSRRSPRPPRPGRAPNERGDTHPDASVALEEGHMAAGAVWRGVVFAARKHGVLGVLFFALFLHFFGPGEGSVARLRRGASVKLAKRVSTRTVRV